MVTTVYDFAIVGAGAAGLNLALAMVEDPWFRDKKIIILDKDLKNKNDRTWCFWEKSKGKWDSIITHQWETGKFITHQHNLDLKLSPYRYKMLPAANFYNYARSIIEKAENVNWVTENVEDVRNSEVVQIKTEDGQYGAKQVFDSRISTDFYKEKDKYIRLLQHFKGWFIKTDKPVFDPTSFTMMDYRIKWKDTASFVYLLPTSETEALIEFTFFSTSLVEESVYDDQMEKYLREMLKIDEYVIESVEKGIIPMSNYPFHREHQNGIMKIGTAGGWVKPSSGYSFKNAERMSLRIINNLKSGKPVEKDLNNKKYHVYDTLFLDVLSKRNELGEELFETMYTKNRIQRVFEFLDEETNIFQDIAIMNTFDWKVFFKAIRNQYF